MAPRNEKGVNGRQPEEVSMMPKTGWSSDKGGYDDEGPGVESECGMGACKPGLLQKLKKVWLFALVAGLSSLFSEYVHSYLLTQIPAIRRQYGMDKSVVDMLTLPSPVASLFAVLILSVFARRIHIPRVLALTSVIAGVCSLMCCIPYIHSAGDMTDRPIVNETTRYTVEKFQMTAPSCLLRRMPKNVTTNMMEKLAVLEQKEKDKAAAAVKVTPAPTKPKAPTPSTTRTPTTTKPTQVTGTEAGGIVVDSATNEPPQQPAVVTDPPVVMTTTPEPSGATIIMPDFEKLSKHPIYPNLVPMAKNMGIDLEAVQKMSIDEQAKYVLSLPPNVQQMLPQLKGMLGDNPDQYFFVYTLPANSRRRRSVPLETMTDPMYSGFLSNMMKTKPKIPDSVYWELFEEMCPYNTHPFHKEDYSDLTLVFFIVVMILHGIAIAPRYAFVLTFIFDNSDDPDTAQHLGLFAAFANLGPLAALLFGGLSMTTYITLEDTGLMSLLNPRWLPAWWVGFLILGIVTIVCSVPMVFFPKRIAPSSRYSNRQGGGDSLCAGFVTELQGLLSSLLRLMTNGVFVCLVLGGTLSLVAWGGVTHVLVSYVSSQFSLEPFVPGVLLYILFAVFVLVGTVVGGFLASKARLTPLNCLKMTLVLTCVLVIVQGANIGIGCDQPKVDKGEKIVKNISTTDLCSKTCLCVDLGYAPVCGSDGISYYSACHAGCGDPYDGAFHDCKCIEDQNRTVVPNLCEQPCNTYDAFRVVFLIGALALGLRFAPLLLSSIRCVETKDIPAALGLKMFYAILFGFIAAPYIYGRIESAACTLPRPECGIFPTCAIYDIEQYRIGVFVTSFVLELVAGLFLILAFFLGRQSSSKYNEKVYAKDQRN